MDIANLVSAHKRAKHFGSVQFAGPFSVLGSTGPLIAARNYCMLLDSNMDDRVAEQAVRQVKANEHQKEIIPPKVGPDGKLIIHRRIVVGMLSGDTSEYLEELALLDSWARAINKYCDNHMIANDEEAKLAFACFHSRLWLDPSKLVK